MITSTWATCSRELRVLPSPGQGESVAVPETVTPPADTRVERTRAFGRPEHPKIMGGRGVATTLELPGSSCMGRRSWRSETEIENRPFDARPYGGSRES